MTKNIIATVLAASFVLTPVTSPQAQAADAGEIGRFLLGAGALLAIGSALSQQSSGGGVKVTRQAPVQKPIQKTFRQKRSNLLPSACLRRNNSDFGPKRYFGQRCLRKNMAHVNRLPTDCLRNVYTQRGYRAVYSARCLRRSGWQFG